MKHRVSSSFRNTGHGVVGIRDLGVRRKAGCVWIHLLRVKWRPTGDQYAVDEKKGEYIFPHRKRKRTIEIRFYPEPIQFRERLRA
jgi:hypothetical protein